MGRLYGAALDAWTLDSFVYKPVDGHVLVAFVASIFFSFWHTFLLEDLACLQRCKKGEGSYPWGAGEFSLPLIQSAFFSLAVVEIRHTAGVKKSCKQQEHGV